MTIRQVTRNDKYAITVHGSSLCTVARVENIKEQRSPIVSSSQKGTSPIGKSVTINQSVRAKRVLHISAYTKEEIADCWYSEDERSAMSRSIKEVVKQLEELGEKMCLHADADFCGRGLEYRTYPTSISTSQRRKAAYESVAREQRRQRGQGISNPEHIAQTYASESRLSQAWAGRQARLDALIAAEQ